MRITLLPIVVLSTLLLPAPVFAAAPATPAFPIDVAGSPAPLFDDPVFHGASDPFVIWNPVKKQWFMYYTQRRATLQPTNGVNWVHGSAIGIAASDDGRSWKYLGTCLGDRDLSEPLKATGRGPEPGITWWAPCFLYDEGTFHMWVTLVDGVYRSWTGNRDIVHFTSEDGITWKYSDTCQLSSRRVIDPTVYKVKDIWYMVYKDEAAGSRIYRSESRDLKTWSNAAVACDVGSQEAPFVFHWKDAWWLIVDALGDRGLRIYKSASGIDNFTLHNTVLAGRDGTRPGDNNVGHHPGIVLQGGPNNDEQCLLFYFTHQGNRTVIQITELELDADGKVTTNRNKYAMATLPAGGAATVPSPSSQPTATAQPARGRGRGVTAGPVTLDQLAIRDVCILPDPTTRTYYMVGPAGRGVRQYASKDLITWTGPTQVYTAPADVWGSARINSIWAPEIHKYKNKYYLFFTFDTSTPLPAGADTSRKPAASNRPLVIRGSTTAVADSITGPFRVVENRSIPPTEMMTLDGTFWVEDGQPYMVFSYEWVQCAIGEMWAVKLTEDLARAADKPFPLFKSSEAPWAKLQPEGCIVTDGPYLWLGKTGKLYMLWSSFDDRPAGHRYQVGISIADSGKLAGPWRHQPAALLPDLDGGHPMLFETFDGKLMMVLHSPGNGNTRARLFEMEDTGETLRVVKGFP